jgi:cellulase/cellobiase CelA1
MRSIRLLAALALALGGLLTAPASAVAATPACQVTYTVTNDWSTGFQGSIGVTNNGAALSSWTLGFAFPGNQ